MPYRNLEPLSKQFTIIVGLTVVGFMAFGYALSFYRNILFEQTLENIHNQNRNLRQEIAQGYRDLEYYRSGQYKDKYAKENLGLVSPGEHVLIIQQPITTSAMANEELSELQGEQQRVAYLELLRQMPVIEHWKLYLFYPQRVQELQQRL
ncbi:hypothetical protein COU80_03625 [Candidatus Peregrinibacteria bacterium CG10_big_fil_rev_8_21_14_0_10_55_24]|nr:MAG: hypothetical protein COU80_03625 [Candidatus Peregrinibacteria bacterium CG10_big_fil_rev_8_21_14_0_10_55_24]